jgi:hypothetical protein
MIHPSQKDQMYKMSQDSMSDYSEDPFVEGNDLEEFEEEVSSVENTSEDEDDDEKNEEWASQVWSSYIEQKVPQKIEQRPFKRSCLPIIEEEGEEIKEKIESNQKRLKWGNYKADMAIPEDVETQIFILFKNKQKQYPDLINHFNTFICQYFNHDFEEEEGELACQMIAPLEEANFAMQYHLDLIEKAGYDHDQHVSIATILYKWLVTLS